MAFTLPQVPFPLTAKDMGVPDLTDALTKGINLGYLPKEKQANLQKTLLDNLHQQLVNQYTPEDYKSTFASRYASANQANAEANVNTLKYKNPGLLGSDLMKDATVAQMLMNKGGQAAVDTHEQIKQSYPDAPLEQTVPLALQLTAQQQQQQQQSQQSQPSTDMMTRNVANSLMQQQGQQALQQPISNMSPLNQSLNNVLNPPQPQQQVQQQIQQQPGQQQDFRERAANAEIGEKEAMANYYNQGAGKGGVKVQNLNNLARQVGLSRPDLTPEQAQEYTNALLDDKKVTVSGIPVEEPTGQVEQALQNVLMANVPAALQTQYYQMSNLVSDLNNFPIEDLAALTGPAGMAKLKYAQAKMAIDPNDPSIDPVARNYLTAVNQATITMDKTRKAWGTSVQPKYVQNTIGKLTNPNDSMWLDSKQVVQNFKTFTGAMNRDLGVMKYKVRHGVTTEPPADSNLSSDNASSGNKSNKVEPPITAADITATAKATGMTEDQVKEKLRKQGRM